LWDAANAYQPIASLTSADTPVLAVGFSPDGKWLVSGGGDGSLKFWQLAAGNRPPRLTASLPGHLAGVKRLIFSPDGKLIATAGADHTIKLWEVARQRLIFSTDPAQSYGVNDLAFSPDGKTLLSVHSDGSLKHWQITQTGG
jgi:WD40 repeat protein